LLMFVAAACATSNVPSNRGPDRVVATTDESLILAPGERPISATINATPDAIFNALQDVYEELGIEIKTLDPGNRVVGNKRFQKMYRLAGSSPDAYLGCGLSATGPVANSSRLTMSLTSQVVPGTPGAQLITSFSGYAEDLSVSKGKMSCASTGKLEVRIQELVRARLSQ
ncbi:MAG TPA: hypothetical protein VJ865_17255, partial [Gemmatimonadaceae bacterium]|nr:hypothetical protein [Gemmatimonadaceae bacterium]